MGRNTWIILLLFSFPLSCFAVDPVPGFADLHNHVFAEYGFGGAWFHGTVEGEMSTALSSCDVEFDPLAIWGNHARVKIPLISNFIGWTRGTRGDTGSHIDKIEGSPHFTGWPRWDTLAHQQNWEGHLKQAHEHGLNLVVISAVNFEPLCALMPDKNKKYEDCSDTQAVDRQLAAARRFEESHAWFKIVRTPAEARSAIWQGKLAVVLSIEVTHLFGDGDWKPELARVYVQGVRTFQLAHQLNNRFTGAAIHNPIFRALQWFYDFKDHGQWSELFTPWKFGFHRNAEGHNTLGLTPEGSLLVRDMMKFGMLVDLAHMSEQAVRDTQSLTQANNNYPIYISHGHFREAMDDGKFSEWEKSSSPWVLDYIRTSGGMFGLRTGSEKTKSYPQSTVPNNCQGSTKSFAQSYQYGTAGHGLMVAFGSDLNGFIQQLRPRFGSADETCGAEENPSLQAEQRMAQKSPLHKRFDQSGFGDVSQLPDIVTELHHFGVDTSVLEHSAENFIRMWERATAIAKVGR